jgi:hypothetical protein
MFKIFFPNSDLESSLGSDDHMMTLSELTNDPMVIIFFFFVFVKLIIYLDN